MRSCPSRRVLYRGAGRRHGVEELPRVVADPSDKRVPEVARPAAALVPVPVLKASSWNLTG